MPGFDRRADMAGIDFQCHVRLKIRVSDVACFREILRRQSVNSNSDFHVPFNTLLHVNSIFVAVEQESTNLICSLLDSNVGNRIFHRGSFDRHTLCNLCLCRRDGVIIADPRPFKPASAGRKARATITAFSRLDHSCRHTSSVGSILI